MSAPKHTKAPRSAKAKKPAKSAAGSPAEESRSWTLSDDEVKALKAEAKASGIFANPYRRGLYHSLIEATASLGVNEWHPFADVKARVESLMGDAWAALADKAPRNQATAKDVDGRLLQSLVVLQRVNDYGAKLLQVGAIVDLKRDGDTIAVRLNTRSKTKNPAKLGRRVASDDEGAAK